MHLSYLCSVLIRVIIHNSALRSLHILRSPLSFSGLWSFMEEVNRVLLLVLLDQKVADLFERSIYIYSFITL